MQTVAEYLIDPRRSWVPLGIPDGWSPLCVREVEATGEIVLAALVDDEAPPETEIVRLVKPGEDLHARTEGLDSAFLGFCAGVYLFLDLPEEEVPQGRRIGHPALEEAPVKPPARRITHPGLIEENSQD